MSDPFELAEGVRHARDFLARSFHMSVAHLQALDDEAARLRRIGMRQNHQPSEPDHRDGSGA